MEIMCYIFPIRHVIKTSQKRDAAHWENEIVSFIQRSKGSIGHGNSIFVVI